MFYKSNLLPFFFCFFSVSSLFAIPANIEDNFLLETENDSQLLTIDRNFSTSDLLLAQQIDNRKKVALVIGNAKYQHSTPLNNPVNDANDIAEKLREFGFEVILATDTDLKAMDRAVDRFYNQLTEDSIALFFYAGHAIQVDGENYLIPIDADLKSASDARYYTLPTNRVRDKMYEANSEVRIAILDACRDNPFARNWRSLNGGKTRGLASIQNQGAGDFIAYATAPGMVASDGLSTQRNGVFTSYLLKHINPDRSIEDIFKLVRHDVARQTNNQQVPFTSNGLIGNFYFAKDSDSNSNSAIDNSNNQPEIENNNIPERQENNDRNVEYYRTRAVTYFQQTLYDEAIALYNLAIELNPQKEKSYNNRAIAYHRKGKYDRAIVDYTRVIELNPQFEQAYHNRGMAHYYKGEYNEAITDYTRAIELNPQFEQAYYYRGLLYHFEKGEYEKALKDFNKVLKLNPNHKDAITQKKSLQQLLRNR